MTCCLWKLKTFFVLLNVLLNLLFIGFISEKSPDYFPQTIFIFFVSFSRLHLQNQMFLSMSHTFWNCPYGVKDNLMGGVSNVKKALKVIFKGDRSLDGLYSRLVERFKVF